MSREEISLTPTQVSTLRLLANNCRSNDTLTKFAAFREEADAIEAALDTIHSLRAALYLAQDVARAPDQDFGSTIDRTLPAGILPQPAPEPDQQHPLRCDDGGQCGVGGYCGECPTQAEQQGDGGAPPYAYAVIDAATGDEELVYPEQLDDTDEAYRQFPRVPLYQNPPEQPSARVALSGADLQWLRETAEMIAETYPRTSKRMTDILAAIDRAGAKGGKT